jgi:peptidoglycan/xylan/chitin deacetylase (PgdA/CDA1 family)
MSIAEIRELARIPQITIGSHSENHAILPNCDEEQLRNEILGSKRDLEDWTGRPIRVFSYPNGDFDERTSEILAEAGYTLAFTTENRPITLIDSPYYVPRLSLMDDGSLAENICHAFGLWPPFATILRRNTAAPAKQAVVTTNKVVSATVVDTGIDVLDQNRSVFRDTD